MRICSVQSHNVLVFHAGLCCLGSLVDRSLPRVGVLALTCALCFMFPLFVSKLQGPFGWELKTSLFAWRTFKLTRPRPPRVWITIPFCRLGHQSLAYSCWSIFGWDVSVLLQEGVSETVNGHQLQIHLVSAQNRKLLSWGDFLSEAAMNFARCILDVTFVGCFGRLPCFKRIS